MFPNYDKDTVPSDHDTTCAIEQRAAHGDPWLFCANICESTN